MGLQNDVQEVEGGVYAFDLMSMMMTMTMTTMMMMMVMMMMIVMMMMMMGNYRTVMLGSAE